MAHKLWLFVFIQRFMEQNKSNLSKCIRISFGHVYTYCFSLNKFSMDIGAIIGWDDHLQIIWVISWTYHIKIPWDWCKQIMISRLQKNITNKDYDDDTRGVTAKRTRTRTSTFCKRSMDWLCYHEAQACICATSGNTKINFCEFGSKAGIIF